MPAQKPITNEPLTVRQKHLARTCIRFAWNRAIHLGRIRGLQPADVDDAGQEACLGVLRAAKDYDPEYQFTTHAGSWIQAQLSKWMAARGVIRQPYYVAELRRKHDGIDPNTGQPLPPQVFAVGMVDDANPPYDVPAEPEPDWLELEDTRAWLEACLQQLPSIEQTVLRLRFGFDETPLLMEEIGKRIRRSRQAVYQIERRALRRLREILTGEKIKAPTRH